MSHDCFSGKPRVFLSYARKDGEEFATEIRKRLEKREPEVTLWQDRKEMEGGIGWWKQIEEALDQVRFLVIVMTPAAMQSEMTREEWHYARQRGVNVYPVKGCEDAELDYASLPNWMRKAHFFDADREWETFVNYLKSDRQPVPVPFMAPDLPEGFIQRYREFDQLITQLVEEKHESPIAITTALEGAGGYGKTTLAIALCHDNRVIGAFDDGILWVALGQNPNILGELTKLYEALTGVQPPFLDEGQAVFKLRERLENRNCLLVIDDVWQKSHLEPFLQGGKKTCARVITTRRPRLVMDTKRIRVDKMSPEEAVGLLAARLPIEHKPSETRPLCDLANRLMEWPLLLKLAGGVIRGCLDDGETFEKALEFATRLYDTLGLTAFDSEDAVQRNDAAAKSIEATLALLKDDRARLSELAIFPENTDLPLHIIELLWGLDDLRTQITAKRLADFAILELDLRAGVVRLHDEIRLYLRRALSNEAALHARLVDRLGDPKEIEDPYALRRLPWHLGKAGRDAARCALLVDFKWMLAKLTGTDIQSLIANYDYLPKEADLRTVQLALRQSAHILAGNSQQLPGQLLGRLSGNVTLDIDALLIQTSEHKSFPWLRPLGPSLTPLDASLVRTLQGHTSSVTAVAITPDGRYVISGSWDNTLCVWDMATGENKSTFPGYTGRVTAVAITPDGGHAVFGFYDNTLLVWNLVTGKSAKILQGHTSSVTAVAITPDGRCVVSGSSDNTLRVWDLAAGETKRTLKGHTGRVTAVTITPDGRYAISGSWDNTLRVWDLAAGETKRTLKGHTDFVSAVAVAPDGRSLVSSSADNTLRLWDLVTGEPKRTLKGHTDFVTAVAVTSDGRYLVSGSRDHTLRVWHMATGKTKRAPFQGHTGWVTALAVTPDGRHLVSGSSDHTLRVWDMAREKTKRTFQGHTSWVTALAVTPNSRYLVSGSWDNTLRVWDMARGEIKRRLRGGHTSWVTALSVTPDGRHLVSGSWDHTLRIWDIGNGKNKRTLRGHASCITAVTVTPDGHYAVSGSHDYTLRLWDMATGQTRRTLPAFTGRVNALAVTPDGRYVVSGSHDNTLRLWRLATGKIIMTLEGHTGSVSAVAVTPDNRQVVSGSHDCTLRVWDLDTGKIAMRLQGHTHWVNAIAITPDGRYLVSGSRDYTLRVWDLAGGRELVRFAVDAEVTTCCTAQDSRTIFAGDGFGRLHFLRLEGVE